MLKLETCVSEDCDGIAFTDHTGLYDVDDNPSGYGGPNVITGPLDFDSYIVRAWRPGTQPPDDPFTFEVDLRNATPVVNDDDQTKWEFTLAELGLTEVVSGHWYFEWIGTKDGVEYTSTNGPLFTKELEGKLSKLMVKVDPACPCKKGCTDPTVLFSLLSFVKCYGGCSGEHSTNILDYIRSNLKTCC